MSPSGIFVAVVGPSGAGKDTLLNGASEALINRSDIVFVRRVITRDADGATEDHDTLSLKAFEKVKAAGGFCLTWEANGLLYALPASARRAVQQGKTVVANLSRSVLPQAVAVFGPTLLIEVTAAPDVLAARLARRGRETEREIRDRLSRSRQFDVPAGVTSHLLIDNSGDLDSSVGNIARAIGRATATDALTFGL